MTLADAQAQLDQSLAALTKARTVQGYSLNSTSGGRSAQRALHESLLNEVKYWRAEVSRLERMANGGMTARQMTPTE